MDYYSRPYNYGYTTPQVRTNKIIVTSLEDALNRFAEPNTVILYRHQDERLEYEIMTDNQGKKSYKTYEIRPYLEPQAQTNEKPINVSIDEFRALESRLKALESKVAKRGVNNDEKSN